MNKFFNLNHPILSCISSLFIITLFLAQITYIPTIKLDIIHHNVRHWGKYKNDLSNYYLKHNADILSLNSHGLDTNKRQFLKIFTYSNLTSGTGMQAGTALLAKTFIKHAHFKTNNDTNSLYTIIHTDIGKILIYSLYRPPRVNTLPLIDTQNALNHGLPTFIIGDFNIKNTNYGHTLTNDLGRTFYNFSLRNNLHFLGPDFKTFFNSVNNGTPDLLFCNFPALHLAVNITPLTDFQLLITSLFIFKSTPTQ